MASREGRYESGWKNGLIWTGVMTVLLLIFRWFMWRVLIYMGDTEIFSNDFCDYSLPLLLVSFIIPVAMYLVMYRRYRKAAAEHPNELHRVAHGGFGRPALVPLIWMFVLEAVWFVASGVAIILQFQLRPSSGDDQTILFTVAILHGLNLALDTALFLLGMRFFKPDDLMLEY